MTVFGGGMKKVILILLISLSVFGAELSLMFWNVENLFDIRDNTKKKDGDFMPGGTKRYTYRAYCLKTQHLADVINHVNPDLLGMVEVENRETLQALSQQLYHYDDWEIIIDEGSDIRGIDPALMFRRDVFSMIQKKYYPVFIEERGYHSRPLLRVDLLVKASGDTLSLFINHWPSRRGGKALTDPYRMCAAKILHNAVKELHKCHPDYFIVMTGDFNDDAADSCLLYLAEDPAIEYIEKALPRGVFGTYYYDGEWIHFDHFLALPAQRSNLQIRGAAIVAPDWIREKPSNGPLRFYKGVEHLGGYSDHFPICLKLGFERKYLE